MPKFYMAYFHGFASAPRPGGKGDLLQQSLGIPVFQPQIDYHQMHWWESLLGELSDFEKCTGMHCMALGGSSLGGFTAEMMHRITGLPTLLLNPAYSPAHSIRKYLGLNHNHVTGQAFEMGAQHIELVGELQAQRDALTDFVRDNVIVFTGLQDTVIDPVASKEFFGTWYSRIYDLDADHTFEGAFDQVLNHPAFGQWKSDYIV